METKFSKSDLNPGRFFSADADRITYLQFNADSTFAYFGRGADLNYYLAAGTFKERENCVFLHWDSVATRRIISTEELYEVYKISKPGFLALSDTLYYYNKKKDVLRIKNLFDRMEIFLSSKDVFIQGVVIDSLMDFPWPYKVGQTRLKLYRKFGPNRFIPLDSIWGYRIIAPGLKKNVYRCTKEFGPLAIAYYGDLVIYHATCPGCPDPTYFSETLDSRVVPLTMLDLKQYFSSNQLFLKLLDEDKLINFWNGLLVKNPATGDYRLLEIYRQAKK